MLYKIDHVENNLYKALGLENNFVDGLMEEIFVLYMQKQKTTQIIEQIIKYNKKEFFGELESYEATKYESSLFLAGILYNVYQNKIKQSTLTLEKNMEGFEDMFIKFMNEDSSKISNTFIDIIKKLLKDLDDEKNDK